MVKKLFKHEFIYYFRSFGLFLPIVLLMGIVTRITIAFGNDSVASEMATTSSTLMLSVSCFALIMFSMVAGVVRFYKNMYSAEGYLTFTLPVTNAQHIFVKLVTAIACIFICGVTVALAVFISSPIESLYDFVDGFHDVSGYLLGDIGFGNSIAFVIEGLILAVLYAAYGLLLSYACITVGQTAKKHRILKAIGAYYVYYIARQVIGTVFGILIAYADLSDSVEYVDVTLDSVFYIIAAHIVLWVLILFFAALCALFWFITQRIMTKKLNLE